MLKLGHLCLFIQKKQALKEYSKYVYDNGIKKDQDVFILLWKLTKLTQLLTIGYVLQTTTKYMTNFQTTLY